MQLIQINSPLLQILRKNRNFSSVLHIVAEHNCQILPADIRKLFQFLTIMTMVHGTNTDSLLRLLVRHRLCEIYLFRAQAFPVDITRIHEFSS